MKEAAYVGECHLLHCHPVVGRTHVGKEKGGGGRSGGKLDEEVRKAR